MGVVYTKIISKSNFKDCVVWIVLAVNDQFLIVIILGKVLYLDV